MKRISLLFVGLILFMLLAGCNGLVGQNNKLVFYNATRTYGFFFETGTLDKPIAKGAKLDIQVKDKESEKPVDIISAEGTGSIKVLGYKDSIVHLKATTAGSGDLTVDTNYGEDRITLDVEEPTDERILPVFGLLSVFTDSYTNKDDEKSPDKSLTLIVGTKMEFSGSEMGKVGNSVLPLIGYGASQWSAPKDVVSITPDSDSDFATVVAEKEGDTTISFGRAQYKIYVRKELEAKSMDVFGPLTKIKSEVNVYVKDNIPIYVGFYDSDGRLIVGNPKEDIKTEVEDNSIVKIEPDDKGTITNSKRYFIVNCLKKGKTAVTISYEDLSKEFTVNCKLSADDN